MVRSCTGEIVYLSDDTYIPRGLDEKMLSKHPDNLDQLAVPSKGRDQYAPGCLPWPEAFDRCCPPEEAPPAAALRTDADRRAHALTLSVFDIGLRTQLAERIAKAGYPDVESLVHGLQNGAEKILLSQERFGRRSLAATYRALERRGFVLDPER